MRVRVDNHYGEYCSYYSDIVRVEEKQYSFILYLKNGFSKEFSNGTYTYYIEEK